MLYALGAVISLIIAAACFYFKSESNPILLVGAVIFGILTIVFGGLFLAGRINKTEDIHVTE